MIANDENDILYTVKSRHKRTYIMLYPNGLLQEEVDWVDNTFNILLPGKFMRKSNVYANDNVGII